jgi:hypothetical protein
MLQHWDDRARYIYPKASQADEEATPVSRTIGQSNFGNVQHPLHAVLLVVLFISFEIDLNAFEAQMDGQN